VDVSFASDNTVGAHPAVLEAIAEANAEAEASYGADTATARAIGLIRDLLGVEADVALVATGTAANVLGLAHVLRPHEAVLATSHSHVVNDEGTAPATFGLTVVPIPTEDGKLRPTDVEERVGVLGDPHSPQPRVVTITQATELGGVYRADEIAALAEVAHAHGLLLHVDGARLGNAIAATGADARAMIVDAGVDLLSLGLTKAGALEAEAIVLLRPELAPGLANTVKRGMQMVSKGRLLGAQVAAMLEDDLWLANARHANDMAARLGEGIAGVPGADLARPVQASAVFVRLSPEVRERIAARYAIHAWDTAPGEHRLMCSWATTPEQVDALVACARG
jgi:threonine aldolase